jgi:hypothetical protein
MACFWNKKNLALCLKKIFNAVITLLYTRTNIEFRSKQIVIAF